MDPIMSPLPTGVDAADGGGDFQSRFIVTRKAL
jgi:hypothetical protein